MTIHWVFPINEPIQKRIRKKIGQIRKNQKKAGQELDF